MRKLTKDQINRIFGINNKIKTVTIYINDINIELHENFIYINNDREQANNKIFKWIKKELFKLPEEVRQHVEYLTCHPTVVAEISFPDQIKSITDGLRPGIETDQKFKDGYWKALIDVRSKEKISSNKMPLCNAGLGGGMVKNKNPSGGW